MPELPDVETFKRYLDRTALHKTIDHVHIGEGDLAENKAASTIRKALNGQTLEETRRHGKYLLVRLSDGRWLMLHFGMTGSLQYAKDDGPRDNPEHGHLVLHFDNGYHLAFLNPRKFGWFGLYDSPEECVEKHDIGPDVLHGNWSDEDYRELCAGRDIEVKKVLMDQNHIAGIGNVYADEILFHAGIRPDRTASALSDDEIHDIRTATHHVMTKAIEYQADRDKMPDSWLTPRREGGAPCPKCDGTLRKIKIGGRSSYYCPTCQS